MRQCSKGTSLPMIERGSRIHATVSAPRSGHRGVFFLHFYARHNIAILSTLCLLVAPGLLQGYFAVFNFIVNLFVSDKSLEIFQPGAGDWYTFWYLVGIGGISGSIKVGADA